MLYNYKWPLIFLKVLCVSIAAEATTIYAIDSSVCAHRNAITQFIMDRTKSTVFIIGETFAIFEQSWNSSTYKRRKLDCKFRVDGKRFNNGIFATIRRLNLRRSKYEPYECIDYVVLKYSNDTYSERICGKIDAGLGKFLSFDDGGATMRVTLVIDTNMVLEESNKLEFSMIFTGYDECDETRSFSCNGPDNIDKCIVPTLVKDGFVNCPAPGCVDEGGCYDMELTPIVPTTSIILSALTSLIFTMCGVGCFVYICLRYYKCVRTFGRDFSDVSHASVQPPIELQARTTPRGSLILTLPAEESPTPTTPDEAKDQPPSYDSLFPAPSSHVHHSFWCVFRVSQAVRCVELRKKLLSLHEHSSNNFYNTSVLENN